MMIDRQGKKTLASEQHHYITVQYRTTTDDGEGGVTTTWSDSMRIPAAISPIQARQIAEYKSINVDATHLVKIRGRVPISEFDRILFGSRVLEVLTVENIQERGVLKVCTCLERR